MRLAWLTDIHLDHLRDRAHVRVAFAEHVAEESDRCVISGDIASYRDAHLLAEFAQIYAKPIYFVLGNHDFWGGSFHDAERQMREICAMSQNLTWLNTSAPVELVPGVEITGVDGWYDAQHGSWRDSDYWMVDWNAIRDFFAKQGVDIVGKCRDLAKGHAIAARVKLEATQARRVFFVTHVPPYKESAMHNGQPSSRTALPYYTSKIMGTTLSAWASANTERELTTLCGHVHSESEHHPEPNHTVLCGAAEYGAPAIVKVFDL